MFKELPKKISQKENLFRASTFSSIHMKDAYSSKSVTDFMQKFNFRLDLNAQQSERVDNGDAIELNDDQLEALVYQLSEQQQLDNYIIENSSSLLPLSVSLFVINDRLWEMMKRKVWDLQKMLAMCTIPLCTWDQKKESTSNPKGIRRWPVKPNTLEVDLGDKPKLKIQGDGGDFSGFIEQSQLTMRKWGLPDTRRLIPNYIFQSMSIEIQLSRATIEVHPRPRNDLDYDFSEHARVFFEHGFLASVPGEDVVLRVGKGKPSQMAGEALLFAGSRFDEEETQDKKITGEIWLRALRKHFQG